MAHDPLLHAHAAAPEAPVRANAALDLWRIKAELVVGGGTRIGGGRRGVIGEGAGEMAGNKGLLNRGVCMRVLGVGDHGDLGVCRRGRVGGGVLGVGPGHVLGEGLVRGGRGGGVRMVGGEVCVIDDVRVLACRVHGGREQGRDAACAAGGGRTWGRREGERGGGGERKSREGWGRRSGLGRDDDRPEREARARASGTAFEDGERQFSNQPRAGIGQRLGRASSFQFEHEFRARCLRCPPMGRYRLAVF